jgi:hypothetical protein
VIAWVAQRKKNFLTQGVIMSQTRALFCMKRLILRACGEIVDNLWITARKASWAALVSF